MGTRAESDVGLEDDTAAEDNDMSETLGQKQRRFTRTDPHELSTSAAGVELIKQFEGLRLQSYQDSVGVWTIGYGHTLTAAPNQRISTDEAHRLLIQDVVDHEAHIKRLVKVPLKQGEFDALSSWVFNLGGGSLASSTLLLKLNAGDYAGAANEIPRWNKAGGKVLAGLTRRRAAERKMFEGLA